MFPVDVSMPSAVKSPTTVDEAWERNPDTRVWRRVVVPRTSL